MFESAMPKEPIIVNKRKLKSIKVVDIRSPMNSRNDPLSRRFVIIILKIVRLSMYFNFYYLGAIISVLFTLIVLNTVFFSYVTLFLLL